MESLFHLVFYFFFFSVSVKIDAHHKRFPQANPNIGPVAEEIFVQKESEPAQR